MMSKYLLLLSKIGMCMNERFEMCKLRKIAIFLSIQSGHFTSRKFIFVLCYSMINERFTRRQS